MLSDLYSIEQLTVNGQITEAQVSLNAKHPIFEGHFPGNPVVPGVCLMTIVKEVLSLVLDKHLVLAEARSVKFLGVINPEEEKILTVHCEVISNDIETLDTRRSIMQDDKTIYKASATYRLV